MKKLLLTGSVLLVLDQLSKIAFYGERAILTDNIGIKYAENTGAAFGILKDSNLLLIIVNLAIILVIIHYYQQFSRKRNREPLALYGILLLFSGATGNLIDRIFLGHVRDFIAIWKWPIFNLADAYNTIGATLIILYLLKEEYPELKRKLTKRFK